MAQPKIKLSKTAKRTRRSHHALVRPNLQSCPNCRQPRLQHVVCTSCGHYGGREVIKTD